MNNKFLYNLLAVSAALTLTSTSIVSPVTAYATTSKMEQTNYDDTSLSANEVKMRETLQKAGLFAKSMNAYSYMLIKNPDVNFEGININGYEDLPGKIVQDQKDARAHALTWDTKVKKQLIDTLTGIIEYDTKFENYYDVIVYAINANDGETLIEGITDLREEIQENQKCAQQLIEALTELRDNIGKDVRAFGSNKELLQSILKNQGAAVEDDQKRLNEVLESVNYYKKLESDGIITIAVPTIPTLIAGGIMLGIAKENLSQLEPLLKQLQQTVDYKLTLNRVVGVAHNSISEMYNALDDAVNALTFMSAQWNDLDSQYTGVLRHIENAADKAEQNKFKFLLPNLNAAKDSWKTLKIDAVTLKEGIKELNLESSK
ncbi:HBL/NHE enterotoxin family protein [Lysinibacillus sp. OF-1]|uniref:HBL/NHE enterotoxin family protein n=1 Tax=Lysinibacillus sp. OF-1 TaxID=2972483 RepID=UPI00232D3C76|nr:HBL/NHE enterotoxin family protein [Lysinibacillus sp. OF-1]WCH45999.1 alpha-helical pore-forming toxin family protein [Lysinibacillus sp. OF-1]